MDPRFDTDNKVALILHEAVYALIRPHEIEDKLFRQDSFRAREINGYFFTPDLRRKGPNDLHQLFRFKNL